MVAEGVAVRRRLLRWGVRSALWTPADLPLTPARKSDRRQIWALERPMPLIRSLQRVCTLDGSDEWPACAKASKIAASDHRRGYLKQSDVPAASLDDALRVPRAILDHHAGQAVPPLYVAKALDIDPKGTQLRVLSGAAIAFGLIEGGAQASAISLTDLARRVLRPKSGGGRSRGNARGCPSTSHIRRVSPAVRWPRISSPGLALQCS